MNNILFFLTPKAMCAYLYDDYTVRQALEKMETARYSALPIVNRRGEYRGTLTEGDLLWALKNVCYMDMRQAEAHRIMRSIEERTMYPSGSPLPCTSWWIGHPVRTSSLWWTIRIPSSASSPAVPSSTIAGILCTRRTEEYPLDHRISRRNRRDIF